MSEYELSPEKTLSATQAGIVFPRLNQYYLFRALYHMGQPEASEFESGKGKPILSTEGIESCAGIELRTRNSYGLLHSMGLENTSVLLRAITNKHSELGIQLDAVEIFIKTDNMREDYERKVRDHFAFVGINPEIHQTGNFIVPSELRIYSLRVG